MRLIDADALKADWKMGDKCEECDRDSRSCQYEYIFSRMDVCSMLDDAPTIDALALLKEREPVKPIKQKQLNGYMFSYACGECGTFLLPLGISAQYCYHCGRSVKWE